MAGATAALFAANLYYAQPLLTTIARDLGLPPRFAGSVVSASQMGYGLGLFFLVPLSDIIENRRLVLTCSVLTLIGIIGVACSHSAMTFLFFALMIGIFSSGAQVLIPYLSHIIPEARRGRILGNVMAGILTTIMLARPFALFVAAAWGWRSVYFLSAFATAMLGIALWRTMPPRQPHEHIAYKRTIISMFVLFGSERRVRRRTMYQAILFACFTMFWAAIPILLAERFGFSKPEIGLFALVGAGGVMAAPVAGRIADRGAVWIGTVLSSVVVVAAFLCSGLSLYWAAPIALAVASLIIDGAIQISQMLSRIIVLDVAPAIRGRINALYMTTVYFSGAVGSMLGVSIYFSGGWSAVVMMGMLAGSAVFLAAMAERWSGLAGRTPASGGIDGVAGPETSGR
ncbi:MFS transporter (plasmid) [Sphingobium sp. SJ10-10]|uniref:MFS transporter n=1 Tax=Sphingobium sp. SJ10-10 TaxID=3114999 RepID=UPI002E1762A6|nr:MFS transporter [Sphingobium sp. SJ10-10]